MMKTYEFIATLAEFLEAAIRSAVGDIQKAGLRAVQITMEEGSLAALASMS
jgi:hypothetical protein